MIYPFLILLHTPGFLLANTALSQVPDGMLHLLLMIKENKYMYLVA